VVLRFMHTADWHLGHTLAGHARDAEHRHVLEHMLDVIEREHVHALLVAGDVYDTGNPPAAAQTTLYAFLARLKQRCPQVQVVVIGGNHDAPGRIDAPAPLLQPLGVTALGAVRKSADGLFDAHASLVPLMLDGDVAAVVVAIPFLRAADLLVARTDEAHTDLVQAAVRDAYARATDEARRQHPGVPLVLMGHLHAQGGRLSTASERPVFGNQHAISVPSITGQASDVAYVALGHLHLAQSLSDPRVCYSGSPIPLSMTERHYHHSVSIVDVGANTTKSRVALHALPRLVKMLRIPDEDPESTLGSLPLFRAPAPPLSEVLDRLRALDVGDLPTEQHAFLEVRVALEQPVPDLRARIEQALEGKPIRLTRIHKTSPSVEAALADVVGRVDEHATLEDLSPTSVFSSLYARRFDNDPPPALLAAFRQLLSDVRAHDETT
jgi:DNA repair protein SbcD/Mre11